MLLWSSDHIFKIMDHFWKPQPLHDQIRSFNINCLLRNKKICTYVLWNYGTIYYVIIPSLNMKFWRNFMPFWKFQKDETQCQWLNKEINRSKRKMYNLFSITLVYCTYQGVRNSLGLGWVGPRPLIFEKLARNLQKEVILIFQLHYSVVLQYHV